MVSAHNRFPVLIGLIYAAALIYGTLYPFSGWQVTPGFWQDFSQSLWPRYLTRTDIITNLLVYIPLGFLITASALYRMASPPAVALAVVYGLALSLSLELVQMFLPERIASLMDVSLNGMGSAIGALIAVGLSKRTNLGQRLHSLGYRLFLPGHKTEIGLVVLALWCMAQLLPLVPSLDVANLKHGLKPIYLVLTGERAFVPTTMVAALLEVWLVAIIMTQVMQPDLRRRLMVALFVASVFALKVLIVIRALTLETVVGGALGLALASYQSVTLRRQFAPPGAWLVLLLILVNQLYWTDGAAGHSFNWIPFRGQMLNLIGFVDLIESAWPYAALAYLAITAGQPTTKIQLLSFTVVIAAAAFFLEVVQRWLPGRYPDITDTLLAVLGWSLPWAYFLLKTGHRRRAQSS